LCLRQGIGPIVQHQLGLSPAVADHFDIGPVNVANAGAHSFAHRFFDGKTTGQAGDTAVTIPNLLFRKKAPQKTIPVPGNAPFNADYFDHVYANGEHI
jgi:hypothetical protein